MGRSQFLFLLFIFCIFLGGASEVTMSEWVSSFIENGIGLPKIVGDILGMAMFAVLLVIARLLYAKYGKNISKVGDKIKVTVPYELKPGERAKGLVVWFVDDNGKRFIKRRVPFSEEV